MEKINITPSMVHKIIKVKARCENATGAESNEVVKEYKVRCLFSSLDFFPVSSCLNFFCFIKIMADLQPCQKIFYTLDGSDVTTNKNLYNGYIPVATVSTKERQDITIKAKTYCTVDKVFSEEYSRTFFVNGTDVIGYSNHAIGYGNKILGFLK